MLTDLKLWIESTELYQEFLKNLPSPLNNVYFIIMLICFALIMMIIHFIEDISMTRRHREALAEREELENQRLQNEIERRNQEQSNIEQQSELNNLLKVAGLSMLTSSLGNSMDDQLKQALLRNMAGTSGADNSVEVAQLQKEKEALVREKDNEINALQSMLEKLTVQNDAEKKEREAQITSLSEALEEAKKAGPTEDAIAKIASLSDMLEKAQALNNNINASKNAEIEKLTSELEAVHQENADKEAAISKLSSDIEAIINANAAEVATLQKALKNANDKADAFIHASEEREEEIAKLQSMLAIAESTNIATDQLEQQIEQLRFERDEEAKMKEANAAEIAALKQQLLDTQDDSAKAIIEKSEEIERLQVEPELPEETVTISKPTYASSAETDNSQSEFFKLMEQFKTAEAISKEHEMKQKQVAEQVAANKKAIEEKLVIEAEDTDKRDIHVEDAAKLQAIDEQKQRVLEEIRRDEERRKAEEAGEMTETNKGFGIFKRK